MFQSFRLDMPTPGSAGLTATSVPPAGPISGRSVAPASSLLQLQLEIANLGHAPGMGIVAVQQELAKIQALLQGLYQEHPLPPVPPSESPANDPSHPGVSLVGLADIQPTLDAIHAKL